MSSDEMVAFEPFGVEVIEPLNAVYPGNDAWLQIQQGATTPGADPAWLQIQGNMGAGPGSDPAWLEVER